ncbi:MAG: fused MFS/spermidine synthase [Gammaproteobacteria bacterium]
MPLFIFSIILLEGFVTVSVQILTIRQLIPFVGNSVAVTSLIIGIFLLFLAYGYRQGGRYKEDFLKILSRNFCIAFPLLGFGLSYPFLDLFFHGARYLIGDNIFYSLGLYLILITAPMVYILGQTVPVTMNLIKTLSHQEHEPLVGAIGGEVLHLSTLGSFLGAVLTALVLMNFFGVASTVFINCILLYLIVLMISLVGRFGIIRIFLLAILSVIIYKFNVSYENLKFIKTNSYANYAVTEHNGSDQKTKGHVFEVNAAHSSYLDQNKKAFPYIETVKKILFDDLKLRNKEILVVGSGGFSITAERTHQNHFTYVDIDKDMPHVVKGSFLDAIQGDFIAQEARAFFLTQDKRYDAIFSDVYNNMYEIPVHLLTQEYFQQIKKALVPGGYALFNIVSQATLQTKYAKRIDNTIRSVFPYCMGIPMQYTNQITNLIYACKNIETVDHTIYTDDKNQAQIDLVRKALPRS